MASSKKPRSADLAARVSAVLGSFDLKRKRLAVGLSGGMDSVVLLDVLASLRKQHGFSLSALHVHHGLSRHADSWSRFCGRLSRSLEVPFSEKRIKVAKAGEGLEAAARRARYEAFRKARAPVVVLAHHLDDQAETVLLNLLRGAGLRGASGMPVQARLDGKLLLRPLLSVSRQEIRAYALERQLEWVEDESNADESLARNFIRRRVGPLLERRFPRWKESLARAARHFAARALDEKALLREFLASQGLRAPSEAKLLDMLRQLGSGAARTAVAHDGVVLRAYRGRLSVESPRTISFSSREWKGERRVPLPELGGELRFRRVRGRGLALEAAARDRCSIRLRSGGERLQPDPRRPRRTLKNLFQEAGIPPWERERLPLLFCGEALAWVPGLGVDARFQAGRGVAGVLPEWSR